MSRQQRSLLAQFRSGILPLQIENGRWWNIPVMERLCTMCSLNVVEDEYHFLCVCSAYCSLRDILYNEAKVSNTEFEGLTSDEKFIYLMQAESKAVSKYLSELSSHEGMLSILVFHKPQREFLILCSGSMTFNFTRSAQRSVPCVCIYVTK